MAHQTGAIGPKDLERVAVDTKVQPKAVAHPTDAADASGHHQAPSAALGQSYLRLSLTNGRVPDLDRTTSCACLERRLTA